MDSRNINSVINLIDQIQTQAREEYWKQFNKNKTLPLIERHQENALITGIGAVPSLTLLFALLDTGLGVPDRKIGLLPLTVLLVTLAYVVLIAQIHAYQVTPDLTDIKITKGKTVHLNQYLKDVDGMAQINKLLETYNIDWEIKLNDFKRLLKDLSQQIQINQSPNYFSQKNKKTIEEIVSGYRPVTHSPGSYNYRLVT